ncbi:MAG TPA: MarR family transcriptional regulator [Dehalococcoidia bacterium]|nr:MarR family transcriptional regulator [Dehalococcoidia bacterium]
MGLKGESEDFVGTLESDAVAEGVKQYETLLDTADSLSIAIVLTLWEANHVQMLKNHRAFDSIGLPVSLTGTRLTILRTLYFAPEKKMALSAISKATNTNLTIVSNLVEALQRGGLVRRVGSPQDRRVSLAELTPDGEEAFRRILPVMSDRMAEACSGFTEEEKLQFLGYLQRLL